MTTENTTTAKKNDLWKVPFGQIQIREGLNIRSDYGDLEVLAENIRENGVRVPMRGYKEDGVYIVVDGHRRFRALELIADNSIIVPFILEPKSYNDEQRVIDMFIMNDGKPLSPLEQAEGVARLLNFGWEVKDIAKKLSKSAAYIGRLRDLHNAPKKLKKLVESGEITATDAMNAITEGNVELVIENGGKVKKINSLKEFKKWSKEVVEIGHGREIFDVLVRVMNNEMTAEDFDNLFLPITPATAVATEEENAE